MTVAEWIRCTGTAFLLVLLSGCGTVTPLGGTGETGPSPDAARSAESLAHYGRAVLAELEQDQETALDHYQQASQQVDDPIAIEQRILYTLIQEERTGEALERAQALVKQYPEDAKSRLLLGLIYRAAGQPDEARQAYRDLRKRHPDLAVSYLEESALLLREDQTGAAIDLLTTGLKKTTGEQKLQLIYALAELSLRAGYRQMQQGEEVDFSDILPLVESAAEDHPEDETLPYLLSDLYLVQRDVEKALPLLLRLNDRNPGEPQLQRKILAGLLSLKDADKAVELLQNFAATAERPEQVAFMIGELYEQFDRMDDAIEQYRQVSEQYPDQPGSYLKRIFLLIGEDRQEEAGEVIDQALVQLPHEPRLYELRAYLAMARDEDKEALADFERAAAFYRESDTVPSLPNFWLNYGLAYQHHGQLNLAAEKIKQAMDEDPEALPRYFSHLWKKRDPALISSGLDILATLSDELPKTVYVETQLALLNKQVERYPEAVAHFDAAEALANETDDQESLDEGFYFWYAAANERIKAYDRAEELFLRAIELKPDFADAHNYLAYMNAERGENLDLAFDYVDLALALEPDNPAFIDTLGWIYYQRGDYELARKELERAVGLLDDDPTLHDHLGDTYHKLGRVDEALTHWGKALELEPGNAVIEEKIDQVRQVSPDNHAVQAGETGAPESSIDVAPEAIEPTEVQTEAR
ncbi:MAG: tetratricopeptide repeat protein [Kiritimatiellae bacterium]|nr:tetratricopeptide repeat protein [Kiritimatiellia bacterium]